MQDNNKIIKDTIDEVLSKVKKYTDQSEQFSNANERFFELLKQQEDVINGITSIANECKNFCDSTTKKFDVEGYQVLNDKMKILSEFVDKIIDNHNDIVVKFQNSYSGFDEKFDKLFEKFNDYQSSIRNDFLMINDELKNQAMILENLISNTNKTLDSINYIEKKANLIQETMLKEFECINKSIVENDRKQKKDKTIFLLVSGLLILLQLIILLIFII